MMFVVSPKPEHCRQPSGCKGAAESRERRLCWCMSTDQNIANTAVEWSGVQWTQMLWPLPGEVRQRKTLISHEIFHRIQNQLKLPRVEGGENAQLDTVDGRYYMQLEWRALGVLFRRAPTRSGEKRRLTQFSFAREGYSAVPRRGPAGGSARTKRKGRGDTPAFAWEIPPPKNKSRQPSTIFPATETTARLSDLLPMLPAPATACYSTTTCLDGTIS